MNELFKCNVCQNAFSSIRSLGSHIVQTHSISTEQYYKQHIDCNNDKCQLCGKPTRFQNLNLGYTKCCSIKCSKLLANQSFEYRKKISRTTKEAMRNPKVREKLLQAVRRPKSLETRKRMSISGKQKFVDDLTLKSRMYTKQRNLEVSKKKILYWDTHPEEKKKVGLNWKKWKARDEIGWRKHLKTISKKGFEKIFSPNGDTSLEIKLYAMLQAEGFTFFKKHEVEGKIYDAFLPHINVLIEIDGAFWHKESLSDCQYEFQRESFYNDRKKEEIARKHNMKLVRIKEHFIPETIKEIL